MSDDPKDKMSFDNDPGKLDQDNDDLNFTFSNIPLLGSEKDQNDAFSFDSPDKDKDPSLASFEALLHEQPKADGEQVDDENSDMDHASDSDFGMNDVYEDLPDDLDESINDATAQSHFDVERVKSLRRAKRIRKNLKRFAYIGSAALILGGLVFFVVFFLTPSSRNNDGKPLTPKQLAAAKAARQKERLDALMVSADKLFDDGKYDAASSKYQEVLDTDDARCAAHFGLGKCFESGNDLEEAKKEYQRAIKLNPDSPAPFQRLANALAQDDKMEAKKVLLKGVAKFPEDEELLLTLANICYETGDAGKALETFKKMDASNLDLKDIRTFSSLLEVESKEDAKKLLISGAKKFKNLSLYMSAGQLAKDNDDRIAILLDAEKEMSEDQKHIDTLVYRIAKAYADDDQTENSLTYLKKIRIEKLDKDLYASVFKLVRDSGFSLKEAIVIENVKTPTGAKNPEILALVLHILEVAPKRIAIQILVLNELLAVMSREDVVGVYRDLFFMKKADPTACFLFATALKNDAALDAATKHYVMAVGYKPDFYEALLALSDIRMLMRQWAKAAISLRKCIKLKPQAIAPREILTRAEVMLGKGDEALEQYALFLNTKGLSASQKVLELTKLAMLLPTPSKVDKYLTRLKLYPEQSRNYKELEAKRKMIFGGARDSDFSSARKGLFRQYRIIHMLSQGKFREVLNLHTPKDEFPDFWKVYVMLKKRIIKRKAYQPPLSKEEQAKATTPTEPVAKKKKGIIEQLFDKTRASKNIPEKMMAAIWNGKQSLKYAEKHLPQVPLDQLALYYILLAEEYKHSKQRTKARIRLRKAMSAPKSIYRPLVEYLYRKR